MSFLLADSPGDDDDPHLNTVFREQDASINSVAWTVRNGLIDLYRILEEETRLIDTLDGFKRMLKATATALAGLTMNGPFFSRL